MNPITARIISLPALLVALALVAVGCGTSKPKPVAWQISITKRTAASIRVDLVGVKPGDEKRYYEGLTKAQYWGTDGQETQARKDTDKISHDLEKDQPWIVNRDDSQWTKWINRGVTELLVMADLPGNSGLWRVALPLDKKVWDAKDKTLEIEVQDTRVSVLTPQKAP
jgi:hypothetical protein